MDHASELEVVPLSSGIDDIERLHKARSHPFTPLDIQKAIRTKSDPNNAGNDITKQHSVSPNTRNFIRIIAPSIGFFGCQFAWACQGGYVDPYLRQLGLPDDMMNYAWILGPISGLIFQPMIGVFSDHCESKHGRRRPFFMAGAVILSICLFLFSHAKGIGYDIFSDSSTKSALVLAFICFWFLDFSTNFMEGPLRALCSDTLTESEQLQSNSWFGIMNGLASTGGFALGYITHDIRVIFGVAAFVVISTSLLTSYLVDESQHNESTNIRNHNHNVVALEDSSSEDEELGSGSSRTSRSSTDKNGHDVADHAVNVENGNNNDDAAMRLKQEDAITIPPHLNVQNEENKNANSNSNGQSPTDTSSSTHSACDEVGGALKEMCYGLSHMPSIVRRCWIVQFCTYFSNFACWVYLTDYFGENIMGGDVDDKHLKHQYDLGVEYGNLAFMFIAGISATFSLLGPKLVDWVGIKRLWIFCLSIYSMVMMISPFIHNLHTALILFSFIGLPMGASFTLPWAVVSSYSSKKDPNNAGLWLSSLNIAECGPELSVGLLGGVIIDWFSDDVSAVFFIAGLVNLISVVLVMNVDTSITEEETAGKYESVGKEEDDSIFAGMAGMLNGHKRIYETDEDDDTELSSCPESPHISCPTTAPVIIPVHEPVVAPANAPAVIRIGLKLEEDASTAPSVAQPTNAPTAVPNAAPCKEATPMTVEECASCSCYTMML